MDRRDFIAGSGIAVAGLMSSPLDLFAFGAERVRLGFIGVGNRGRNHINEALLRSDVEIVAVCDIQAFSLQQTKAMFAKAGKPLPKEYTGEVDAYKKLLERKDIDAVIISTPWDCHKLMAIDCMLAGKYVGCEVIAGITVQDHWDILKVYKKTLVPYMTLENVCYRRDVMAVLNMARQGLFGELVHAEGGYQHDLRAVLFNDGMTDNTIGPYFGADAGVGEAQWRTQYNIDRNGDIYPTHGAGPVMNYLSINKGNRFTNLVSFASKAKGLGAYVEKVSPGNKNANLDYKNGDIITTMINCAGGETVTLTHDTHLPRPYSLGFRLQGTKGLWMDVAESIHIEDKTNKHGWDPAKLWLEKYDHPLWKRYADQAAGAGHGGMDWFVFNAFVQAVKQQKQTPIDIYDSLTMSVITPLSEQSLKEGNMPQAFPDFTDGGWKTDKPTFAMDDSGF